MMDDIVGLVLVQVISSLGESTEISAAIVVRPVLVSVAYAVLVPLACLYIVRPVADWLYSSRESKKIREISQSPGLIFWCHTAVLIAFVASSSYAGTSNLFAAYLAGACITWWDTLRFSGPQKESPAPVQESHGELQKSDEVARPQADTVVAVVTTPEQNESDTTGLAIFDRYYSAVVGRIFRPFFFASIGFSIPIASMFTWPLVWRGLVYTILMTFGKLICGLWLVRFSIKMPKVSLSRPSKWLVSATSTLFFHKDRRATSAMMSFADTTPAGATPVAPPQRESIERPQSLYPAALLGSATVSRGEIGFLISAIAQTSGLYTIEDESLQSELFLIVTWAVMLCTIIGPVVTELLTKAGVASPAC